MFDTSRLQVEVKQNLYIVSHFLIIIARKRNHNYFGCQWYKGRWVEARLADLYYLLLIDREMLIRWGVINCCATKCLWPFNQRSCCQVTLKPADKNLIKLCDQLLAIEWGFRERVILITVLVLALFLIRANTHS